MNLSIEHKQKPIHGIENRLVCQEGGGKRSGMDWELWLVDAFAFEVNNQRDPAVQHGRNMMEDIMRKRKYMMEYDGRYYEKENVYMHVCITGSLCCTVEIDRTL